MHTQKIAITMPKDLVATINEISKKKGLSRSKFISAVLKEKIISEKKKQVRDAYDRIYSDELIQKEQLNWTRWFEEVDAEEGQEW
ncbi:ribbon-helix-helix protein, CopG family [uncultured Desulfobacter sp.]|jgi:metal-responsive CopG/Arc/MetJ family transcriptional regulator|uniref:ribbon-helix-helix protein, CopG family n=1 Tax=uncultured Desulfobacter sp. TaxID=240139 RepID=UPI002AA6AC45|nr:ribbon-helix-helix protein, CopG family [uncultured Desulfobacter sp.]